MRGLVHLIGTAKLEIGRIKGGGLGAFYLALIVLITPGMAVWFVEPILIAPSPIFRTIFE